MLVGSYSRVYRSGESTRSKTDYLPPSSLPLSPPPLVFLDVLPGASDSLCEMLVLVLRGTAQLSLHTDRRTDVRKY